MFGIYILFFNKDITGKVTPWGGSYLFMKNDVLDKIQIFLK